MADKTLYTEDSIQSLDPREFTRLKPGVYCGDTTYSTQLLVEAVSNSVDEFRLGHGTEINIATYHDDRGYRIVVEDFGQGFIPGSFRDDGKTILEAAFSVINTSGKYKEDGVYEGTSLGSFGIGAKLCCFLSHWMEVQTFRDGKVEEIVFDEGIFQKRNLTTLGDKTRTGTCITYYPSEEFFTHIEVEYNKLDELFNTIACLCPGLTINFRTDRNGNGLELKTFFSKNGLNDLAEQAIGNSEIIHHRLIYHFEEDKYKGDLILTYTQNYSSTIVPYVNTGLTEKGPHITQVKTAITREFNKFYRDKGWLKDKDENLTGDDIQEGMYVVFNLTVPNVAYNAQVKTTVTKIDMGPFITGFSEGLSNWLAYSEKDIKVIFDKAINARKAREAAKKARDAIRDVGPKDKKKQLLNLPTKLVDCWSRDRSKCELFIVEGDSASGGLVEGRDAEFTAIFPIRGKIIAAYKNSLDKILANQEVINLIKAIGLDMDAKTGKLTYDAKKLRYARIFMAADADPDGASIRNLLIEMFWWLCPDLILKGHVYTTMPPLFRITTKKNEYIFLKDADALEKYKTEHKGQSFQVNRNKGLGEQDPDELAEALLNPATRNVAQLTVSDVTAAADLIECLLGPSVPPRRAFLLKHSEEANDID